MDKVFQGVGGGVPGHSGGLEGVDPGLDQDIGDGENHTLKAGGESHPNHILCPAGNQPDVAKLQMPGVL